MSEQPLVSVIVPVYKVEQYLEECLDSLLAQTYTNWEAICIDDGSPDNSIAILERYAAADKRFRVYRQQNAGLGAARNAAFARMNGDWMLCLDSDDSLAPNALQELVAKTAADIDVVTMGMQPFGDQDEIAKRWVVPICWQTRPRLYADHLTQTFGTCYIWMRMVRASIIKRYSLFCDSNVTMWEDVGFSLRLAAVAGMTAHVGKILYNYRVRRTSLVGGFMQNMAKLTIDNLTLLRNSMDWYEEQGVIENIKPWLPWFFTAMVNYYLANAPQEERHLAFDIINEMEARFGMKLYRTKILVD